jgi:hypothetical protein
MARATYVTEDFGTEVVAPSGYYQPTGEELLDYDGKQVLYVWGSACIEASCCGIRSWAYVRVEGYLVGKDEAGGENDRKSHEIDTITAERDRAAIGALLLEKHPGARIEFR